MNHSLQWKKYPVLNDGFICLVDVMGDDSSIVQAARVSYGRDERSNQEYETANCKICGGAGLRRGGPGMDEYECICVKEAYKKLADKDRNLIRYLLNHSHTTPFEMVEFKFLVRVPMDCWRQWIRHRTANVNEYSTRYTEAIDSQQTTSPGEWRLQATDNKQGSSGFLEEWPEGTEFEPVSYDDHMGYFALLPNGEEMHDVNPNRSPGEYLNHAEQHFQAQARILYEERLALGIAKEQARKDLPLSTYTEAYWKCDLHNIFNFLRLRMDSHAQYEIRMYANAMAEIVKQVVPVAWEAFEDYVLYAKKFSRMEMEILHDVISRDSLRYTGKPDSMTDREWKAFLEKLT